LVGRQALDQIAGEREERVTESENGTVWDVTAYRLLRHGVVGV
jgi:hypothetical protein